MTLPEPHDLGGPGDEWFSAYGVLLKVFCHEHQHEDVAALYRGLPKALALQLREPVFSMQ